MRINILNNRLLHLALQILSPFILLAQSTDSISSQKALDPLVITAEKTPVTYSKLMRVVQVISKEEISKMPAHSLSEVLEFALNTDIRNRGSFGTQADISIRGGSFDQTLILLNGVNITDPQTGHHNLNIPLDIAAVDRIEILNGAGARVFGPNAFNGVINIITSVAESTSVSVSGMIGEYGLYQAGASINGKIGKSSHHLQLSKSASDGYISNTDFEQLHLFYHNLIPLKNTSLELQSGYSARAFGANSFYTPKYPNQFEETKALFASIRWKSMINGLSPVFYWRRHWDRFELFRSDAPVWYTQHNYHRTDVLGSNANYTLLQGKKGKTTVGYDFRYESIVSNKLGDSLTKAVPIAENNELSYYLGKSRTHASMFAEQAVYLGKFSLSAGLLANLQLNSDPALNLYPGLDAAYQVNSAFRIFASANRTLRMPTFTDLYYNDAISIGNARLKPEEAISIETGLKFQQPGIHAHMAVFKRYGRNMIDWVKGSNDEKWQAQNLTSVNLMGFETEWKLDFKQLLKNECFIYSLSVGYSFLNADKASDDYLSKYVLDILKHKADVSLSHRLIRNFNARWSLSYQDRTGGYIRYVNGAPETLESPYEPFFLLDGRVSYTIKSFELFVEASNILDVTCIDFGNVPQPRRWIRGGFRFSPSF
jgi:iron complex outermembrane receptor protein